MNKENKIQMSNKTQYNLSKKEILPSAITYVEQKDTILTE